MNRRLFGTDGIRGTANSEPMTVETALRVGMAAGLHFSRGAHRHRVVIGKDTRLSGYMIEPALTAGFVAAGMDPILVGPMPTPAVAMLTRSLRADLGVMISASHNPYHDNGIKLFGPDGFKLNDGTEAEIEARMENGVSGDLANPEDLGRALRLDDALGRYTEFVKQTLPRGQTLTGLKVVVDCANGAGYKVAPTVLWELGAEVVPVAVQPDGYNINKNCGSTHPSLVSEQVIAHGADIGLALDGDADRVLIVDENGELVDGDQLMGLIARSWQQAGRLAGGGIVATVMSNLGLERFLTNLGIGFARTQVGDRYVVEEMRAMGRNLGGEQSGHIIMTDYTTTGDGIVAALQVLSVLVQDDAPASRVCRVFDPLPQVLKSVPINGADPMGADNVKAAIAEAEAALENTGRLLIRKSGTEPLIRVMAEGEDAGLVGRIVDDLAHQIAEAG